MTADRPATEPTDDFEEMLAGLDRIIHDKDLQQQLLDAGLLVRTNANPEADIEAEAAQGAAPLDATIALGRLLSRVQQMYEDWPTTDMEIEADIAQAKVALESEGAAPRAEGLDVNAVMRDIRAHFMEGLSDREYDAIRSLILARIEYDHSRPSDERRTPIVEVVGNGDGTMNVLTEDGMRWRLTEDEYLAWPRRPSDERVPESEDAR